MNRAILICFLLVGWAVAADTDPVPGDAVGTGAETAAPAGEPEEAAGLVEEQGLVLNRAEALKTVVTARRLTFDYKRFIAKFEEGFKDTSVEAIHKAIAKYRAGAW